ncbi:MAG: hypothetical protein JWO36_1059 [Myxococcales bacterium]|nr:hypothetical protein [Myxococcales bacterium]
MFSVDLYTAALRFAATQHDDQKFPGTDLPYLVHVVTVASEVIAALQAAQLADPDLAVQCALLHDTIEDTGATAGDLAARFGRAVSDGVRALSKDPRVAKPEQMADSLTRIKLQPREIWIVKLADRTTNMAEPPAHWALEKRRAYREEAIVIADALGSSCAALDARLRARIAAYVKYC